MSWIYIAASLLIKYSSIHINKYTPNIFERFFSHPLTTFIATIPTIISIAELFGWHIHYICTYFIDGIPFSLGCSQFLYDIIQIILKILR